MKIIDKKQMQHLEFNEINILFKFKEVNIYATLLNQILLGYKLFEWFLL